MERHARWLLSALRWATHWRTEDGFLLSENPLRGYSVPREKNPRRPVATTEQKFATEMVNVPDRVVARLGGWKSPRTLDLYSQPGEEMMLEALGQRRRLREAK